MKVKILTLAAIFACSLIMVNAQTPTFQKGDKVLNLGIGFGGYSPSGYQVTTPSVSASFEVGVKDNGSDNGSLGIGGYIGYASYKENGNHFENDYWTVNRIMIGARGTCHFHLADKLDTYGSVNRTDHPTRKPFGGDIFVGGRYYFSDKIAAMGELALGAYLTLGISLKI